MSNRFLSSRDVDRTQRAIENSLMPDMPPPLARKMPVTRERALLLAVLQDAVEVFAKGQIKGNQRAFSDAHHWLFVSRNTGLFSFESICDHLDLDPQSVRDNLRRQNVS